MKRRRAVLAIVALCAIVLVGAGIVVLTGTVSVALRWTKLGRGIHFVTIIGQPKGNVSPLGSRMEVVEEWVSSNPLRWRAQITGWLEPEPTGPPWERVFVFNGDEVLLLVEQTKEYYVIDPSVTARIRGAQRPFLPQDLFLPSVEPHTTPRGKGRAIELNGEYYASVIVERDVVLPAHLFTVPRGYKRGGIVQTAQELIDAMALGWPHTLAAPEVSLPLEKIVKGNPRNATAHDMLAIALWVKGDLKGAEQEFARAARLNPSSPYPHNALAAMYESHGEKSRAIAELEISVALNPKEPFAWENLARLYKEAGQAQKAATASARAHALRH